MSDVCVVFSLLFSVLLQMQEANMRKLTANIAQNGSGTAYKPPVATPQGRGGSNHSAHSRSIFFSFLMAFGAV